MWQVSWFRCYNQWGNASWECASWDCETTSTLASVLVCWDSSWSKGREGGLTSGGCRVSKFILRRNYCFFFTASILCLFILGCSRVFSSQTLCSFWLLVPSHQPALSLLLWDGPAMPYLYQTQFWVGCLLISLHNTGIYQQMALWASASAGCDLHKPWKTLNIYPQNSIKPFINSNA